MDAALLSELETRVTHRSSSNETILRLETLVVQLAQALQTAAGVINGQQLKDDEGEVFLDAGEHSLSCDNWQIYGDGRFSMVHGDVMFGSSAAGLVHGLQPEHEIHGPVFFGDVILADSGIKVTGDSEFFDYLTVYGIRGSDIASGIVYFGDSRNVQINPDGGMGIASGLVNVDAAGTIMANQLWTNGGVGIGILQGQIDFEFATPMDVTNADNPPEFFPFTLIRGTDNKIYWSDGSTWNALY